MTGGFGRWAAGWIERGRKAGLFLLIVAACAGLGLLIALPLWLFATREPRIYTVAALSLLAAGLVALAVRAFLRRLPADPARPRRSFVAGLLSVVITAVTLSGLYLLAVLFYRGVWILGIVVLAVFGLLLWLLGAARASARKRRKAPPIPAENIGR